MADVQAENGYTRLAHALLEALLRAKVPGRHKEVFLAVCRLTWGWDGRKHDAISSQAIANVLGADAANVRRWVRDLLMWKMLERQGAGPRGIPIIGPQKDYDQWLDPGSTNPSQINPGSRNPGAGEPDYPGTGKPEKSGTTEPASILRRARKQEKDIESLDLFGESTRRPPRVLNVLATMEGEWDEKIAWWEAEGGNVQAWATANEKKLPSAVVACYRRYLAQNEGESERPHQDAAAKARLTAAAREINALPKPAPASDPDLSALHHQAPSLRRTA